MNNNKYIVLLHNMHAGSGSLLGEFNSNDEYVIADEIKQELIKSNKLIKSYKQQEIISVATVGSYSFDFVTYVQLGENNQKRISLFLIENVSLNEGAKELKTFLKSVVVNVQDNNLLVIKREFNMYIRDESTGIDMLNSNLKAILDRKSKVASRSNFLNTELSNANKEYVLKMLKIIKGSGPYGNQLLNEFRKILKLKGFSRFQDNYWANLKNVLDGLIIKNALVFNPKTLQQMKNLQDNFIESVLKAKEPKPEEKKENNDDKKKAKKPDGGKKKPKKSKGKEDGGKGDSGKGDSGKEDGGKGDSSKVAEPTTGGIKSESKPKSDYKASSRSYEIKETKSYGDGVGKDIFNIKNKTNNKNTDRSL